jgi:flagellar hook protein FlgE
MYKGEIMSDILISALHANEILHANASSNVANMNTQDYKSLRTTLTDGATGTVDATTSRSTVEGTPTDDGHETSNVDLPQEFTDMVLAQRGYESILSAIKTREDMMTDLMNTLTSREE